MALALKCQRARNLGYDPTGSWTVRITCDPTLHGSYSFCLRLPAHPHMILSIVSDGGDGRMRI